MPHDLPGIHNDHNHDDHDHDDHEHDHAHDDHAPIQDGDGPPTRFEILERAVRELLIDKGVLTAAEIQRQIDNQESRTPAMGAYIVAKAWADPAFKAALKQDAKAAITSLGIDVANTPELQVLENTDEVHHVVVCTLCSCYPRMILGVPPAWYKSKAYRSRVVADPRGVLAEFGLKLPERVKTRVFDSTADMRYLVLPLRPPGTEGWSEDRLAKLISRDAMIGVAVADTP
ncbi:MAG: nitrile hydratase subunit alpha [Alphaproteobacteria bacterium]